MKRLIKHITVYCLFTLSYVFTQNVAYADDALLKNPNVTSFIQKMVDQYHFEITQLTQWFQQVKIRHEVMHHINRPLESNTWDTYQMLFVNEWRIKHGVEYWNKNKIALEKAEKEFGVPASIIVATIGVETKYGQRMGDFRVMDSLSNIAFSSSPRANFFKRELEHFLLLSREQQTDPLSFTGSYAGAMGQPQFMPSSIRHFAIPFSGSQKIDLRHNDADVIGSVANYYAKHGWKKDAPIAIPAIAIGSRYEYLAKKRKLLMPSTIAEYEKLGINTKIPIQNRHQKVRLVELPLKYQQEYWLAYPNFGVIKSYNPSNLYAMAVFQLSGYIAALRDKEYPHNG